MIFILLAILGNIATNFGASTNPFLSALELLAVTIMASPFIIFAIQDIVLGDEIKHKTLSNAVGNGISRDKVIFSKIITILVFSMIFSLIVIGVHILISFVLFGGNVEGFQFISQYFIAYLSAIPLWIGLISFNLIFSTTIQNQVVAVSIASIFIFIVPNIMRLIGCFKPKLAFLYELQPYVLLKRLTNLLGTGSISTIDWLTFCAGLGLFVISTAILIVIFRKKDF